MILRSVIAFGEVAFYCLCVSAFFSYLHIPAASLLGSLVATSIAGWLGRPVERVIIAKGPAIACVGLITGLALSPDVFRAALAWPLSFVGLILTTLGITATNYWIFRQGGGESRETSFFSSIPGALSVVVILVEGTKGDLKKVLFAQLCRVFALLSIAPFYFSSSSITAVEFDAQKYSESGVIPWAVVLTVSVLAWLAMRSRKIAIAAFLGPLVGAGALSLSGFVSIEVYPQLVQLASGALGMIVGARLGSAKLKVGLRFVSLSLLALFVAISLGCLAGAFFGVVSGVGAVSGVLAFSPGSMEMMVALGISLDANVAYIVFHHLIRVLGLMAALPFLYGWLRAQK